MCIECELNPHRSCSHCQNFETELVLVCPTHCSPSSDFILALSSQHSRCIETHTKVHPFTSHTLSLVVEDLERELRRTTWDYLVSGLFFLAASTCSQYHPSMTGHRSSYLRRQILRVWWPRSESFDNVAVHGGVTVCDLIFIRWINNEFSSDLVSIHIQRWIGSMCIQFTSPQAEFKCERNAQPMRIECALTSV